MLLCLSLDILKFLKKPGSHPQGGLEVAGLHMAPGNKTRTFKNTVTSNRRPASSGSSAKKKKRGKKKAKGKSVDEQSVRCNSPLVYNPEAIVQELMQKYGKETKEIAFKDLYEYKSDETECALNNLYFNEIHPKQVMDLMTIIAADEDNSLDIKLFFSLCALSERFFYTSFVTEDTTDKYAEKQWLEAADFSAIICKVADFQINEALRNLLHSLGYKT